MTKTKSLEERLSAGEYVICAEGYLLNLCRMGYLAHGIFVPEVILEQPEVLRAVHYEFVHAGTDVTVAFQVRGDRYVLNEIREKEPSVTTYIALTNL